MSTRGAIAVGTPDKWRGVYQHFDSYPEGLGAGIWEILHKEWPVVDKKSLDDFVASAIDDHPGGWSSFPERCYCHDEYFAKRDGSIAKDSEYYSEDGSDGRMDQDNCDPLFIEWVYVIEPEKAAMHILADYFTGERKIVEYPSGPYNSPVYKHFHVMTIDLNSNEPDWEKVDDIAREKMAELNPEYYVEEA